MSPAAATAYEITVAGHLDDHWSDRLGGLLILHHDDGTSVLTGRVADQAGLHGVLCGLRDIGAVLLMVRAVDEDVCEPSDGIADSP